MDNAFCIRKPVADDVEFIMKTWMREVQGCQPRRLARDGAWIPAWPDRLFYRDYQHEVLLPLFARSEARVICPRADANIIECVVVGKYSAPPSPEGQGCMVVHFAYTKPPVRRFGLCRAALQDLGWREGQDEIVATEWSKYMSRFQREDLCLNRFALFQVRA